MAELPYMQFFPADWLADTRMLTASAKGVWIDTLAVLWNAPERGFLRRTERAWGRLWGVEPERVPHLLEELDEVAEIRREDDGIVIASRRMVRDEIERERSRNSKRPEEKKDWSYRDAVSRLLPNLFPPRSQDPPGGFPEDSRPVPGDIPESRGQRKKGERNNAPAHEPEASGGGVRRPSLEQAKAAAAEIGIDPQRAENWWHTRESSDWLRGMAGGGTAKVGPNWRSDLVTFCQRSRDMQPLGATSNSEPPNPNKLPWE